jgi:hypothetical protein
MLRGIAMSRHRIVAVESSDPCSMKNAVLTPLATAGLAALTLLAFTACSSNTASVTDTWTAPDVSSLSFKKITVIATTSDGATRRISEDAFAATLPGVQCIPSYALIANSADMKDPDKVTAAVKAAGIDGIVVMRLLSDKNEINVTTGMDYPYPVGYRSFGRYYGGYAAMGFNSTTVSTDRVIEIEWAIHEAAGGKLVWSGVTRSNSPGNVKVLVDDAVKAIRAQLVKQHLVPNPVQ